MTFVPLGRYLIASEWVGTVTIFETEPAYAAGRREFRGHPGRLDARPSLSQAGLLSQYLARYRAIRPCLETPLKSSTFL